MIRITTAALAAMLPVMATAQTCDTVRLADLGWTDNMAQNGLAEVVLTALGYGVEVKTLSLPITFESLATGDIDVFLDQWLPSMEGMIAPYQAAGTIEVLGQNMAGAKYTLATNPAGAALGIADFADLAGQTQALDGRIYGVEPGNDGNRLILAIMEAGDFGLDAFKLVETSEQAMLTEVMKKDAEGQPVVWLAWAPHPMNTAIDITYLSGGDAWFGPDFGGATVHTNARAGFVTDCPNTGRFFQNLTFTVEMENTLMAAILNDGATPVDAARAWLAANPDTLGPWLEGVTTRDGGDALAAVTAALE
jgi:glycine betaine/proline transport system substrate-binding protein